ncbi:hypothetical protein GALL_418140 [mine drainage metagenome]|uniref:Uncharacterized protein n=1 Tax=mine drainage metagenome TaxID=410659 RepID=A0A1J5PYF0_9ZZZZ
MFRSLSPLIPRLLGRHLGHLLARRQSPCPAPSAPSQPQSAPTLPGFSSYHIHLSDPAALQLLQAAGIGRGDLVELLVNGHFRSVRERALGDSGAWAHTPQARAALSTVSRDLHLLVFDPEREVFLIAYAKADPQAARLTVTGVVPALQYEQAQWHLLPIALYRALCAQSIVSTERCECILAAALGERDPRLLPIVFALENSKRAVWVEIKLRDGREKRLGVLPFGLKQQRAADLPELAAFWDWVQSRREGKTPIHRSDVASLRLLGHRDPFDILVTLA